MSGIPVSWEKYELENLFEISKNKFNPKNSSEEKRCVELEHLSQKTGKLLGFTNSREQASIKNVFKKGNVLFGKLRPYLKKYWKADFDGVCSSEIWVLNGIKISNNYLFQFVQSDKFNQVANISSGSKMPRADWKYMSKIPFNIPSTREQNKIVDILSSWDNAISIQTQLIQYKEELKKGLMQSLLTGKVRFSQFKDTWKEVNITDIASISIGLVTTMTKNYVETGIPLIRNSDIKPNKIRKEKLIYLNHEFANKHENRKLKVNDIVTVHTGEIGVSAVIDKSLNGCHGFATLNTRIIDENVLPEYICWYFNSEKNINFALSMATGDGRSNFNLKDFNRTKIPLPSLQEQRKIVKVLTNVDKEIYLLQNELEELKKQKKGLMQKLLTGKVKVKV